MKSRSDLAARDRVRIPPAFLLLLSALARQPLAQTTEGETPDEVLGFARALDAKGYPDLAAGILEERQPTLAGPDGIRFQVEILKLRGSAAEAERNPLQRFKLLSGSAEACALLAGTGRTDETCQLAVAWFCMACESAIAAAEMESDDQRRSPIRAEGLRIAAKAMGFVTRRIAELQDSSRRPLPSGESELRALRFAAGSLSFFQALLHENREGVGHQIAMETARQSFEEFEVDHPDHVLSFHAGLYAARIARETKREGDAADVFDDICERLVEVLRSDPAAARNRELQEVTAQAFLERVSFLLRTKKDIPGVIQATERIQSLLPSLLDTRAGADLVVMLAEAHFESGQPDPAGKLLDLARAKSPGGPVPDRARELLYGIHAGKAAWDAWQAWSEKSAEGSRRALTHYGGVLNNLDAIKDPVMRVAIGAVAHYRSGLCHRRLGDAAAAATAFGDGYRTFRSLASVAIVDATARAWLAVLKLDGESEVSEERQQAWRAARDFVIENPPPVPVGWLRLTDVAALALDKADELARAEVSASGTPLEEAVALLDRFKGQGGPRQEEVLIAHARFAWRLARAKVEKGGAASARPAVEKAKQAFRSVLAYLDAPANRTLAANVLQRRDEFRSEVGAALAEADRLHP